LLIAGKAREKGECSAVAAVLGGNLEPDEHGAAKRSCKERLKYSRLGFLGVDGFRGRHPSVRAAGEFGGKSI